jgi:GNAT superfamily N-acetyltransferase
MIYVHVGQEKSTRSVMEGIEIKNLGISNKKEFLKLFNDAPKRHLNELNFYGAYEGEDLVGGIVIDPRPDNFHYKSLGLSPDVIIEFLYVLKEYRGRGIGGRLFEMVMKHKTAGLRTGGMTSNMAKNLYLKSGFRVVKEKGLAKYWYYDKKSKKCHRK